jgi:hypothetical protein
LAGSGAIFREEALDPSQDGGVYDRDAPLHGQNDKKMVEMADFEERGILTREFCARTS